MQNDSMHALWRTSHISGGNAVYVETMYEQYIEDPNSVPPEWRSYFERLPQVNGTTQDIPHSTVREYFQLLAKQQARGVRPEASSESTSTEYERKQVRVVQLISAYRQRGHQHADLDPLGLWQRPRVPDLDLAYHKLSEADLDTIFQTGSLYIGKEEATLREILDAVQRTYCASVGAEFMHIVESEERHWIQQRMDKVRSAPEFSVEERVHLLERLTAAEGLEKYLGSKFPGTKRFGLEGGESLIPMLDALIQRSGHYSAKEIVLAMAHRGRLNVLVNILGKNPAELFEEFEGHVSLETSGDVKYHQGFSSNVMTVNGEMHLALAFNPSHLEIVSPVAEGSVRARQDRRKNTARDQVIPIIMHGDAAFAGQGVVMETFQMSQTRAYTTGGTIHIVINNQVGFTTSRQEDARSTEYCTDIAKMVQAPIFHVNGDDPEAVLFVTELAMDYRQQFDKDVVIDLICYRRRGHNEADEPAATQPLMYQHIRKQTTTRDLYARKLIAAGVISEQQDKALIDEYRNALDDGKHVAKSLVSEPDQAMFVDWRPYLGHDWTAEFDSRLHLKTLQRLGDSINQIPEGFVLQRQVQKIVEDRRKMAAGTLMLNWGMAEILAYASLIDAGYPIRLTGQDVGRGTFSHRHAVLHNQKDGSVHVPLQHLAAEQPEFDIYDSFLSEEAVLGFEYGYSTTAPNRLVIWEAQFGDFANGAQVVIDQFITSGEHKWQRLSGLTMLLPHGYEGQGPEHSSARLERFLQMCAEHNVQVCVPTTPAQVFHMLRRQVIRPMRRPLIVMTPKSLLRHKAAVSSLEELADSEFQNVIGETSDTIKASAVKRVVLCSGKVYYDLRERRDELELSHIAIVRLEQLYPFPELELADILAPYKNLSEVFWCQEEPMNQGAWYSSQHHMRNVLHNHKRSIFLECVARPASAAPAAGYMSRHLQEQEKLISNALTKDAGVFD